MNLPNIVFNKGEPNRFSVALNQLRAAAVDLSLKSTVTPEQEIKKEEVDHEDFTEDEDDDQEELEGDSSHSKKDIYPYNICTMEMGSL